MFEKKLRKKNDKYGIRKVEHAGRTFDSGLERDVYDYLLWLQKSGEIVEIESQVTIKLTDADIGYRADFVVTLPDGTKEVYEAKGVETEVWRLKKRLYKVYGPHPMRIFVRHRNGSVAQTEHIIPSKL